MEGERKGRKEWYVQGAGFCFLKEGIVTFIHYFFKRTKLHDKLSFIN